jgi:hypothetical protein
MKCIECKNVFDCGTVQTVAKESKLKFWKYVNSEDNCKDFDYKKQELTRIENIRTMIKGKK